MKLRHLHEFGMKHLQRLTHKDVFLCLDTKLDAKTHCKLIFFFDTTNKGPPSQGTVLLQLVPDDSLIHTLNVV